MLLRLHKCIFILFFKAFIVVFLLLLSFGFYVLSLNQIHTEHGFVRPGSLLIHWRANTSLRRECRSLLTGRLNFQILVKKTSCHSGVTSNKRSAVQRMSHQPPQCVSLWRAVLPLSGLYMDHNVLCKIPSSQKRRVRDHKKNLTALSW